VAVEEARKQGAAKEQSTEEAWREVGQQFEALGESLSRAVRAAWEREETQQHVRSLEDGVKRMVNKVERTVKEAGESKQGKKLHTEAEKTAETLRTAGEQTWREARPQLLAALKRINAELQRFTESLEQKPVSESEPQEDTCSGAETGTSPERRED
jgi:hypothetical protein